MRHVKMLGLLAFAVAALMAFAGPASATLEDEGGALKTGATIHTTSQSAWTLFGLTVHCQHSTKHLKVSSNGATSSTSTVQTMWFSGCGNHTVTVNKAGTITINDKNQVFSTGAEVTVLMHSFLLGTVHCIMTTNNTDIGDLTEGTGATIDSGSPSVPVTATDGACGEESAWEGIDAVLTPHTLNNN